MKYFMYILYLLCTTGGITCMKLGGDSLKIETKCGFGIFMNWTTFLGFLLYVISFLLWQKIISSNDISIIVPILTGIVQIIVLIIGIIVFKENISILSIIGGIIIVVGIVIISFGTRV